MEDALRREIREETGLEIHDIEFVGYTEFVFDDAFWKRRHFIFFDYACRTESSEVRLNDEAEDYVWVPLMEASCHDVEPYTRRIIELYIAQRTGR
jgi:nucleoside triphosphatase